MSYGLIGMGQAQKREAMSGTGKAADLENQRNMANDQLKQAAKDQKRSNQSSMAGTGAMIGMMTPLGPVGAAIGAGVGYMIGSLF